LIIMEHKNHQVYESHLQEDQQEPSKK